VTSSRARRPCGDALARRRLCARAAELRAEWRAEEEEWTRAALERFEHGRTLTDVLRAAMHRGDEVLLGLGADALRGVLTHVGDDWCALDTPAGACDVPVAHGAPVVCVVERARRGGVAGDLARRRRGGPAARARSPATTAGRAARRTW
jgi:hypothetical protein